MANVLVTGATGFIGRHLVPAIVSRGHAVTILARNPGHRSRITVLYSDAPIVELDALLRDPASVDIDAVVHLAGIADVGSCSEQEMMAANADLTGKLVAAAKKGNASRFIFLSSVLAVSANSADRPVDDSTDPQPDTAYGRAKLAGEAFVDAFSAPGRLAVSIRAPMVIGAEAKGNWARLMTLAASPFPLPFGALTNRRSLLSVDSLCEAIIRLIEVEPASSLSGSYALADTPAMPMRDIIRGMRQSMGRPHRLLNVPRPVFAAVLGVIGRKRQAQSLLGDLVVDPDRFMAEFGFQPARTAQEALRDCGKRWHEQRTSASGKDSGRHHARRLRQLFDQALAAVALVVTLPLMLTLAVVIRMDSPGPAFFVQHRVGQSERTFRLYKFRTMYVGTPEAASHEIGPSALTKVGTLLRRTKLDELPQLINVVRGEMAFVGPRPCLPSQTELIEERRKRGVFDLRPGITGVAQVAGVDMSDPVRLATLEASYDGTDGLMGDAVLVLRTIFGAGRGDRTRSQNL